MTVATLFAALALAGCGQEQDRAPSAPPSTKVAPPPPRLPVVEPPLGREALIHAVLRAGSALALQQDDRADQAALDGRPFSLRMRFGCAGEQARDDAARGWGFDEKRRVLRIRVEADITGGVEDFIPAEASGFEAVEGFWLSRPWLVEAACPPPSTVRDGTQAAGSGTTEQSAPRLIGLAQFYSDTDARTHRARRGYEATAVLPDGVAPSASGYDLWLTGRLKRQADGRVILCRSERADAQPSCIVSVEFDRVAITPAGSDEAIASWTAG